MTLSGGVGEVLAERGEGEDAVRLEALTLEALAKTCGALGVTCVGGLVRRVDRLTGTGFLSFSTSNALW